MPDEGTTTYTRLGWMMGSRVDRHRPTPTTRLPRSLASELRAAVDSPGYTCATPP